MKYAKYILYTIGSLTAGLAFIMAWYVANVAESSLLSKLPFVIILTLDGIVMMIIDHVMFRRLSKLEKSIKELEKEK